MTFTHPTKRTTGQCTCKPLVPGVPLATHLLACPALYPLQPQPGDEPDTLTKLTRLVRSGRLAGNLDVEEQALALISEAAEERKRLLDEHKQLLRRIDAQDTKLNAQQERIRAFEDTQRYASDSNARYLKMGQQQGRVELATELLGMTLTNRDEHLNDIVRDDAEH